MLVDDTHAVMEPGEFGALPEYSGSLPTGQTMGKRWKREVPEGWVLGEYVPSDRPGMIGIQWRWILLVHTGAGGTVVPGHEEVEPDALEEFEVQRQARIAAGVEQVCRRCGCSDTRACPGGCSWAFPGVCSRCARGGAS